MVGHVIDVGNERTVVQAQVVNHGGYADNVVVAAANEADQSLPSVLAQDTDASEGWGAPFEVGIGGSPLLVEGRQVWGEVEVVVQQGESVVGGGDAVGRKQGAIVDCFIVLAQEEDTAVEGTGPDVVGRLAPSGRVLEGRGDSQGQVRSYLNDWPQRRVVAMHSSARVVGSLCHVAAIADAFTAVELSSLGASSLI